MGNWASLAIVAGRLVSATAAPGMEGGAVILVLFLIQVLQAEEERMTVFPRLIKRVKRESQLGPMDLQVEVNVGSRPLHLLLAENDALSLGQGVIEWVHPNGTVTKEPIIDILKQKHKEPNDDDDMDGSSCFFAGAVQGEQSSLGS